MMGCRGQWQYAEPQRRLSSQEEFSCSSCSIHMREYIRPARTVRSATVNKIALHAEKCPNRVFSGVLGEFCTGDAADGGVLGEFCTGDAADGGGLGEFCIGCGAGGGVLGELCIGVAEEAGELCRGGPHVERVYVRLQSLRLPLINRRKFRMQFP